MVSPYKDQYKSNTSGSPFPKSKWGDIYYNTPGRPQEDLTSINYTANPTAMIGDYMGRAGIKFNSHWNDILDNVVAGGLPGYMSLFDIDENQMPDWVSNFIAGGMGTPVSGDNPLAGNTEGGWLSNEALGTLLQGLKSGEARTDPFNDWANSASDREITDLLTLLGSMGLSGGHLNPYMHGLTNKLRDYARYQGGANPNENQGGVQNLFDFILNSGLLEAYGLM